MAKVPIVQISLESSLNQVADAAEAVKCVAEKLGFSAGDSYNLQLGVVEAINNVILHAYKNLPGEKVDLQVHTQSGKVVFELRDWGLNYPGPGESVPHYDAEQMPDLPENGMGVYLIHCVMDEVSYQREPENNLLVMTKRLP
jgi:serine/threonine-protein kinase RsbW